MRRDGSYLPAHIYEAEEAAAVGAELRELGLEVEDGDHFIRRICHGFGTCRLYSWYQYTYGSRRVKVQGEASLVELFSSNTGRRLPRVNIKHGGVKEFLSAQGPCSSNLI